MKKKHSVLKKISLLILGIMIILPVMALFLFFYETKDASLDMSLFGGNKNQVAFAVCDNFGNEVDLSLLGEEKQLDIKELPNHVKNAFIAIEDKRFYSHNGIDVKRIVGATIKNLKKRKFSEGASTITQQLIKNTHLSREKTLTRKMKEIKLSLKAEKVLSKDKILEEYLSTIYFGNGAYGIENASSLYFSKSAIELDINESATLAGIINAPRIYDPLTYPENCLKRRNLVLSCMEKQGYISNEEYQKNAKSPLNIVKNSSKTMKCVKKCIISEACDKLKITENQLKNMNIKIKCNIDFSLQNEIDKLLQNQNLMVDGENGNPATIGVFVVDNKTKNVVSVNGILNFNVAQRRQPGSLIKPILVYAPALENGQIFSETIVKDEPISIDGYAPQNASKTFHGNVSVRQSVEKSLNVPAVKILSNVSVAKAKGFASGLGVDFDKADTNLALALGGMTNGITIKQIADAYSCFATGGEFCPSSYISEIVSESGEVLYKDEKKLTRAMTPSTAYLISDMLKGVCKNGTARRLSGFDFDLCAKTGTVGVPSSSQNSDAYTACYTTDHTIVCYYGTNSKSGNLSSSVNGASYPANLAKEILSILYKDYSPSSFEKPSDVVTMDIDTRSLEKGNVSLALPQTPNRYKKSALFSVDNLPPYSSEIDVFVPALSVKMEENQKPILTFDTKDDFSFKLVRTCRNKQEIIYSAVGNGSVLKFQDNSAPPSEICEYQVYVRCESSSVPETKSNIVKLMSY